MQTLSRLKKRSDFVAASRSAKAVTNSLILQERRRDDDSLLIRIGFTASKKVGNAVVRNRAKRRMRALARELILTNGKRGYDYVLIARKNATVEFPYNVLQSDLAKGLERLNKMKCR